MNGSRPQFLREFPLIATAIVLVALFATGSFLYNGFFSWRVLANIFSDNAFLGISAVGMTLVIFSGGIDLSVGAVMGFTSILSATLIVHAGFSPVVAWALSLFCGGVLGAAMGVLIQVFEIPAFLTTLAGLFFARGLGFWISTESVGIAHPLYAQLARYRFSMGNFALSVPALIFLCVMMAGVAVGHYTRFGRNLLAIGGSESSALLMGLPIASTKIAVYTISGVLSALAGIIATLYTGSGNPSSGVGLELDAIAVVVIGGTLLSGGRGNMVGTLLGVLILGTIQTAVLFDGRLSSWWVRIVVGALLLIFILLQRALAPRR